MNIGHLLHLFLALVALTRHAHAAPQEAHIWRRIEYPPIPVPSLETEKLTVLVGSGGGGEASHLRFDVLWSARRNAPLPAVIADPSRFVVRLHLPDGKIIQPNNGQRAASWIGAGGMGVTWSLIYIFPWQTNVMDEAWIEFALAGQTYWIELPYGFTRNPADPLPSDSKRGEPVFPPTMKALGEADRLVPWLHVNYDCGKIQNGWRLSLEVSNSFDANAEAVLYREDSQVGKSMFLWKLDTPRTAMEIKTKAGSVLSARAMGVRLHEDGMRRSDDYSFDRYPEEGRDWGRLLIKVDDKTYECVVPSSLFKYTHGVTDIGNARRIPMPSQTRNP